MERVLVACRRCLLIYKFSGKSGMTSADLTDTPYRFFSDEAEDRLRLHLPPAKAGGN
jgi:hypothetical protein